MWVFDEETISKSVKQYFTDPYFVQHLYQMEYCMYSPYSPKMKRNANTLCFTLPGFKHSIYVPFTGRRLAVCERCKKNFKTRDHCRTRDCHVDLPWSETFVCVSLDPSCTDEDGNLLEGPFYARTVPPIAFNYGGELDRKTPICAPCKDKNYTRNYCRNQKRHRQLPWSTVYVILTLTPDTLVGSDFAYFSPQSNYSPEKRRKGNSGEIIKIQDGSGNDDDKQVDEGTDQAEEGQDNSSKGKGEAIEATKEEEGKGQEDKESILEKNEDKNEPSKDDTDEKDNDDKDEDDAKDKSAKSVDNDGDDKPSEDAEERKNETSEEEEAKKMKNIPRSRTLLANISCKGITIEWLELDPVLQSQYPHLKTYSSRNYDSPQEGPMAPMAMGMNMGYMMGMNMGMGGMAPMAMGMGGGMHGTAPMGMGMSNMNYGYMGMGGDMSGGGAMNNYDGSPMHQGMRGTKRGGGGGSGGYSSPQGMQMFQYDMMRKGQGGMSNDNTVNHPNSSPYDGGNQGGMYMMNRGQWTPYSTPDYYGISQNSGGDGGGRGPGGMNMAQSQMAWQRQQMYSYGQRSPVTRGPTGDKEGNLREESDDDFDGRSQKRIDNNESGRKRKHKDNF